MPTAANSLRGEGRNVAPASRRLLLHFLKSRRSKALAALVIVLVAIAGVSIYFYSRQSSTGIKTTVTFSCLDTEPIACAHANLQGANLAGEELAGANFTGANLKNADFTQADLENATLAYANLANTNFSEADLTGANLNGTNYNEAIFCDTIMPDGSANDLDCSQ